MFGLQRSGTNYLHWIVDKNTSGTAVKRGGWKHAFPGEQRLGLHGASDCGEPVVARCARLKIVPVAVRKDFDHWLPSIRRRRKDYDRGDNYREVWEAYYDQWSGYAEVVRYEDFLVDFETAVCDMAGRAGLHVRGYRQPERVPNSPPWKPEHRDRYV